MPIYEYVCGDCGNHYEQLVMSRSASISCPRCSSKRHTLQLSVFSAPAKSSSGSGPSGSFNGGGMPSGGGCCGGGGCGCN